MTNTIKKNTEGFGYKYTELADINRYIESIGEIYFQEIEPHEDGRDYVVTHRLNADTGKEIRVVRGCKVPNATLSGKSNPAQEYGSALTYARRYSLLMAYGLATTDNDAEDLSVDTNTERQAVKDEIQKFVKAHGMTMGEVAKDYKLNASSTVSRLKEVLADLKGSK